MICLENETLGYANQVVLESVNLRINRGERVVLLGHSGCGKTTLLNHIYDQYQADTALIPQSLGLVDNLSAFHNIYMGQLHRFSPIYNLINLIRPFPARVEEIQHLLERLSLSEKLQVPVSELSGGQRQRVAVARALYSSSDMLLADEPVSALDGPKADLVLELLSRHFPTALITLHNVEKALQFGTRIIVLRQGRIALDHPAESLTREKLEMYY